MGIAKIAIIRELMQTLMILAALTISICQRSSHACTLVSARIQINMSKSMAASVSLRDVTAPMLALVQTFATDEAPNRVASAVRTSLAALEVSALPKVKTRSVR